MQEFYHPQQVFSHNNIFPKYIQCGASTVMRWFINTLASSMYLPRVIISPNEIGPTYLSWISYKSHETCSRTIILWLIWWDKPNSCVIFNSSLKTIHNGPSASWRAIHHSPPGITHVPMVEQPDLSPPMDFPWFSLSSSMLSRCVVHTRRKNRGPWEHVDQDIVSWVPASDSVKQPKKWRI